MAKPVPEITIKGVLRYAEELRERATRARVRDPYANPYSPSEDTARKLCSQLGPAGARHKLAERAAMHGRRASEEGARSARAEADHLARQVALKKEREVMLASLSLGRRLDAALLGLSMLSETRSSRLDADRVTGSREYGVHVGRRQLERDKLVQEAEMLVMELERALRYARRRPIEEAA